MSPDTGRAKDQGEGELVRARRGTDAPPSRPARHPPAGREPGGGGAGAPSSPKTSLKSSSSWAPQFAVVIGVAQGAVAPQAAAATGAATAATAPQRRFMPGRASQKVAAPRQTFRAGTATPSVPFRTLELAARRTAPGAAATASLSRHSRRSRHSPPCNSRRRRRRAPAPSRAPDPAPYRALI